MHRMSWWEDHVNRIGEGRWVKIILNIARPRVRRHWKEDFEANAGFKIPNS
jgi:hypothetical protein